MAKNAAVPKWQRSLVALSAAVIAVVVIGALYWAQAVFIPVGMAVFLAFMLSPLVRGVQRRGVNRIVSVLLVVFGSATAAGLGMWVVGLQVSDLLTELPNYSANIRTKIKSVRALGSGSARFEKMVEEIGGELKSAAPNSGTTGVRESGDGIPKPPDHPTEVILQPQSPPWLGSLPGYIGSAIESVANLALAFVLLIFMLVNREDLRNRFLRLVGHGRMSSTTKAVDDAGRRISRYLLMQAIVNGTYGLALTIGLYAVGVKYAVLWGCLAAVLRYIPYIGAWVAAAFPVLLSLAMSSTWWPPIFVVTIVLVLELVSNNVLEPLLYGQSMGVSTVAQLVSAAFWAFLWGPVGLILSAPLTVVLLVLGKYVPQLEFLEVLLGDEPALEPSATFYQRLLARDQDEATDLALAAAKSGSPLEVYDRILIPALTFARRDRARDALSESDMRFVVETVGDILTDIGERIAEAPQVEEDSESIASPIPPIRILACPATDEVDRLCLLMLRNLLDPAKWQVDVTASDTLSAELVDRVEHESRVCVCVGSLPPGGLARTRYLCKRLHARFPSVRIHVGRWGLRGNIEESESQLQEAGADSQDVTLAETCKELEGWRMFLGQQESRAIANHAG